MRFRGVNIIAGRCYRADIHDIGTPAAVVFIKDDSETNVTGYSHRYYLKPLWGFSELELGHNGRICANSEVIGIRPANSNELAIMKRLLDAEGIDYTPSLSEYYDASELY
jgi:hypothetical protein